MMTPNRIFEWQLIRNLGRILGVQPYISGRDRKMHVKCLTLKLPASDRPEYRGIGNTHASSCHKNFPPPTFSSSFITPSCVSCILRQHSLFFIMSKTFSQSDVASHNKPDNLWIIIDEDVYDLTKFQDEHPGQYRALLQRHLSDHLSIMGSVAQLIAWESY
jgi:hypothetical protein